MLSDLPTGFYACLFGATVSGGLSLWLGYVFLRRARVWARLRALPKNDGATTVVEFPFVLLLLVVIVLLTWQLGFMCSAYLVMDYTAFSAVRSAAVVIPEEHPPSDDESGGAGGSQSGEDEPLEPMNKVNSSDWTAGNQMLSQAPVLGSMLQSSKGSDIRQAAVFAIYPVSGVYRLDFIQLDALLDQYLGRPGLDVLRDAIEPLLGSALEQGQEVEMAMAPFADFANRYAYAFFNTRVRLQPDVPRDEVTLNDLLNWDELDQVEAWMESMAPEDAQDWWADHKVLYEAKAMEFKGGDVLTVEVSHDFQCAVPYAGAILSGYTRRQGVGWYVTLTSRASMLNEGYEEKEPEK